MRSEIPKANKLEQKVFALNNEEEFDSIALEVYHFQFANNPVYAAYCKLVSRTPDYMKKMEDIPFLPISFFKTHNVNTTVFEPELFFKSSGTTGSIASTHYIKKAGIYEKSFLRGFEKFYGNPRNFCIIGLLPSYFEKGNSSLVYMVDHLIKKSAHAQSGFYLNQPELLFYTLNELESRGQKTILIGVSYALLDFASKYSMHLNNTIIMETGGMKGMRKEMVKEELYGELKKAFGVLHIHSEYGMTELLSQAYGIDGIFKTPPWMKILLRDETDPFEISTNNRRVSSGAINVIDLANIYSCSFIATEDIGKLQENGFEVLGRMDNADIRGCSLLLVN